MFLLSTFCFSRLKTLRFENHTYLFLSLSAGEEFGKILSLLKTPKNPIILGWFLIDFFL
jgi:hypothetical protein